MADLHIISEKLSQLINYSDVIIDNVRQQNIWTTSNLLKNFTGLLNDFFSLATEVFEPSLLSNILSGIQNMTDAQQRKDYVLLGDLIELDLLPSFYELQGLVLANMNFEPGDYFSENIALLETVSICDKTLLTKLENWHETYASSEQICSSGYAIEPTNSGYLTLSKKRNEQSYYYHSNSNPWKEARTFAGNHLDEKVFHYTVVGLGLGYHIVAMLALDARVQVTVLESDLDIIGLMFTTNKLPQILTDGRFRLVYSPDLTDLNHYTDNSTLVIHYPTLNAMDESPIKEALLKYFLHYNSVQEQKKSLDENFYYNQQREDPTVDLLKDKFSGKTVIYIGGGPSAETKLSDIRAYIEAHPDTITVCAGKVYRKLLNANFIPDYMIITDPKPGLVWQTRDIPETRTQLFYIATGSRTAVGAFHGKRHIFYQKDYPESETFAARHHYMLISTGGSVSTAAVDLILQLGCQRLITVGLDLAYPKNNTHAFGIQGKTSESLEYKETTDLHGQKIQTSPTFLAYKEWIEKRIACENSIDFINVTDGVIIKGMQNVEQL